MLTEYVLGFRFREHLGVAQVALIRKRRPSWQAGRLNGVGGKLETCDFETVLRDMGLGLTRDFPESSPALYAMSREFCEETGLLVPRSEWRRFGVLTHLGHPVHLFTSFGDGEITSTTDEEVDWYDVHDLQWRSDTMRNLSWAIPMALDPSNVFAQIEDNSPIHQKAVSP